MYLPEGSFAPVPTPLWDSGDVDTDALGRHLTWLQGEGLDGALILGTNGEFASLPLIERKVVADAAARAESGLKLILNVGSCALAEALEMTAFGAELGYDALMCPPPWYFKNAPVAGLAEFFRRVLDASKLPVLLYHIPQMTGVGLSDELLDAIGEHENLVGIKDIPGLPDVLFVIDSRKEEIAVLEANRLNIPVVAIVDTNSDPDPINYVIPGNDDALRAIRLFTSKIADAVLEGRQVATEGEFQQVSADGMEGEYAIMTEDGMIVTEKGVVNPESMSEPQGAY